MRAPNTFSGSTQLVGMALEGVAAERPLFALPTEPGLPALFGDLFPHAAFVYHDYAAYRHDRDTAPDASALTFAARPEADEAHDLAVLFLPKGRELIAWTCAAVSVALAPGASVLIVGPKRSAIRSSRPVIEEALGPVEDSRAARHCVLLRAKRTHATAPADAQATCTAEALGHELTIVSLPGVFSHGRLDEGTRLLLDHLEAGDIASALNWGCGAGVIAAALKRACPAASVDAVDTHVMALEATRLTLEANGLDARVWPSDGFSDVADRYDLIVSNPPFHSGMETDFTATQRMIRAAGDHLTRGGRLVIVANSFIGYPRVLRETFRDVRTLAETPRFRVIEAQRPMRHES